MGDLLVVTTRVVAGRDAVWHALSAPAARGAWWPGLSLEARPGAHLVETWTEDGEERRADGAVTEVIAGRRLGFRWSEAGWPRPTEVAVVLESVDGGTLVTVTESGLDGLAGPALVAEHREGWLYHLDNLRRYVEESA